MRPGTNLSRSPLAQQKNFKKTTRIWLDQDQGLICIAYQPVSLHAPQLHYYGGYN
jgi:hypothetical protein